MPSVTWTTFRSSPLRPSCAGDIFNANVVPSPGLVLRWDGSPRSPTWRRRPFALRLGKLGHAELEPRSSSWTRASESVGITSASLTPVRPVSFVLVKDGRQLTRADRTGATTSAMTVLWYNNMTSDKRQ